MVTLSISTYSIRATCPTRSRPVWARTRSATSPWTRTSCTGPPGATKAPAPHRRVERNSRFDWIDLNHWNRNGYDRSQVWLQLRWFTFSTFLFILIRNYPEVIFIMNLSRLQRRCPKSVWEIGEDGCPRGWGRLSRGSAWRTLPILTSSGKDTEVFDCVAK